MNEQKQTADILKEIFGGQWAEVLSNGMPSINFMYSEIARQIWGGGALSAKEKCLLLAGVFMTQGRAEMLRDLVSSIKQKSSASSQELLEVMATILLARGPIAVQTAYQAGLFSKNDTVNNLGEGQKDLPARDEVLKQYEKSYAGKVPDWIALLGNYSDMSGILENYYRLRGVALGDGVVSKKVKELILVAANAATLYREGLAIHASGAVQAGCTKSEMKEALLIAFLGGGIVAWIEGTAVLCEKGVLP